MANDTLDKQDEAAIVAELPTEIAGYSIKPWGIRQISKLSLPMKRIYLRMREDELTFDDMAKDIPRLVLIIMPEAAEILKVSLELDDVGVDKIPQDDILNILTMVINLNMPYLKNWVGLTMAMMQGAAKAAAKIN